MTFTAEQRKKLEAWARYRTTTVSGSVENEVLALLAEYDRLTQPSSGDQNGLVAIDETCKSALWLLGGNATDAELRKQIERMAQVLQRARDEIDSLAQRCDALSADAESELKECYERIAALEAELAEAIEERDERNAACSAFCDDRNKAREALRKLADYVERLHMHAIPEGHRCTELLDAYDVLGVTK